MDKQQVSLLLQGMERVMAREAIDLNTVHLEGLGQFVPAKHPEYLQENPETGEAIMYPPRYSYLFKSEIDLS